MKTFSKCLGIAAGATCLAAALYALLAMPGVISDRDSTVALSAGTEVLR
jgi:hypothetical protein